MSKELLRASFIDIYSKKTIKQIRKEIDSLHKYLQDTSGSWVVQSKEDYCVCDKLVDLKEILEKKEDEPVYIIKDKIRDVFIWGIKDGRIETTINRKVAAIFTYKEAEYIVANYYKPQHLSILKQKGEIK